MKLRISAAVFLGLLSASVLAEPVLYGNVHVTINKIEEANGGEIRMDSHTSSIGIKGSEDLEDGLKLIYKVEFGYDTTERNEAVDANGDGNLNGQSALVDRDQWLGFAMRDFGVLRLGTISTGYKSSGASIDPLYRTILEGRGFLGTQSALHDGYGVNGGRSTNTVRFDTMESDGAKIVASYSLGEMQANTYALGAHYDKSGVKLHLDYLKSESAVAKAFKVGGQYDAGNGFLVGGQYENGDVALFGNGIDIVYMMHATYISGKNAWVVTYGGQANYSKGYGFAVDRKLSSSTDLYVGMGFKNYDAAGVKTDSAMALGLRHKF